MSTQQPFAKHTPATPNFTEISLKLASPETILEWSHGEVTKPETINYRTQRPEKHGLFDERIFGPVEDYECSCKKYRGIRYKGIVCEKCGVEVTRAIVRRERMGHIDLCIPVSHIWFLRGVPSRIAMILGITASSVEKVIYFAGYIVTKVSEDDRGRLLKELDTEFKTKYKALQNEDAREALKTRADDMKKEIEGINPGVVLDEASFHRFSIKYSTLFEARIGAEAIFELFKQVNLQDLLKRLEKERETAGAMERAKLDKRLSLVRGMVNAGVRPEWMFLTRIPVIPPAIRPMVALEGGRHASSDLNDLYRRVINRNNRLKKLIDIMAPDVILRNEKRILQEAVDALIDNSIRHGGGAYSAMSQAQRRPLKSLSDYLKSKQGYFRQNLLGKRVDYSGRSVIVIGPELALDQCGLPKHMALELFRPFVIAQLLKQELAYNIRGAGRLIEDGVPEVWAILENVIKHKHVLLNRAPTLHRQGIQAFRPVLIEGNAIQVHPLVCRAFNADFDGDQMAVHVPLSEEAQMEAREIISANKNILKPGSAEPVVSEKLLDMALGAYWMTKVIPGALGEGKYFSSPNDAINAYDYGVIDFRAKVHVLATETEKYAQYEGKIFETTVGRLIFNSVLPSDHDFINDIIVQRTLFAVIIDIIDARGPEAVPPIVDKLKKLGLKYATLSGTTWGIDEVQVPKEKPAIIEKARGEERGILAAFEEGLISRDERRRMIVEVWHRAKTEIERVLPETLDENGSAYEMWKSGARGSLGQIAQMAGMKGLIVNTRGETVEFPILSSMKEGMSPIEYFTTTHGSRKGLADTALQTAKAGYLTRRLFVVAQDAIVTESDCKTKAGVRIGRVSASGIEIAFSKAIKGRILSEDAVDSKGRVIFPKGHLLTRLDALTVEESTTESVVVRSPMTCKTLRGVCQHCYGIDLTTNQMVDVGEAVGTVAAQAIGEPGTQLTMNTKHAGGAASVGGDVTSGLPRVEEVFEKRQPKIPAVVSKAEGIVVDIRTEGREKVIVVAPDMNAKGAPKKKDNIEYEVHYRRVVTVSKGDTVMQGQLLTDGSALLPELFKFGGQEVTQDYIISEVNKIYELQGVTIARKHIELIVKQMMSRVKITASGDSPFTVGDVVEEWIFVEANNKLKEEGKEVAKADKLILGITETSLSRKSFLSAASFQNTTRVLINAAVKGSHDNLAGLMENVIIGKLIPAGSGFKGSKKYDMIETIEKHR
ncbi:DNA-directed RNA polymerase subunit beta' [Candidatus Kaiserbacteria bacterium RIFCSPLOWO2_01_FULL_45_25]|uniref:DNA-directed RNA polymerase subunit beta' n=1 Tax=Candidatus Kaiserbacteria bacterium RIFCSPLOWO2_12_FULL_45_26 TaxID=1798525 RepID=A0A1F6FHC6_9BACT|nr:MAG: DNA-directed RNA polymerase subunit beta' [Candidatus Kaiserbacteria bacterium RIFCSPLOWO2_01_FULL_45_25]OGG85277.1 MAG: DNA-directed RNA polymerase subunit beta' [Candidatus Kaiserbacteria bacterium RIFCSPLOWO2_12_FULL_45_26]